MKNPSRSSQVTLTNATVLGVGISLGGCAAEPADNGGSAGSSQTDHGATTDGADKAPAEADGSQGFVGKDGDVPDWVAAGFPIYPGSKAAASNEAGDVTNISFSVPDADEQGIYDRFVDQCSQNGWETANLDSVTK